MDLRCLSQTLSPPLARFEERLNCWYAQMNNCHFSLRAQHTVQGQVEAAAASEGVRTKQKRSHAARRYRWLAYVYLPACCLTVNHPELTLCCGVRLDGRKGNAVRGRLRGGLARAV